MSRKSRSSEIAGTSSFTFSNTQATDVITDNVQIAIDNCSATVTDDMGVTTPTSVADRQANLCFNPFVSGLPAKYGGQGKRPDGTDATPNTDEVYDFMTGNVSGRADFLLYTASALLRGSVLELPAGDLGFAVGTELRQKLEARGDTVRDLHERVVVVVEGDARVPGILKDAMDGGASVLAVIPHRETLEDLFVRNAVAETAGNAGSPPAQRPGSDK